MAMWGSDVRDRRVVWEHDGGMCMAEVRVFLCGVSWQTQWPAEAWQKGLEGLSPEDRSWLDVSTAAFLEKVRGRA